MMVVVPILIAIAIGAVTGVGLAETPNPGFMKKKPKVVVPPVDTGLPAPGDVIITDPTEGEPVTTTFIGSIEIYKHQWSGFKNPPNYDCLRVMYIEPLQQVPGDLQLACKSNMNRTDLPDYVPQLYPGKPNLIYIGLKYNAETGKTGFGLESMKGKMITIIDGGPYTGSHKVEFLSGNLLDGKWVYGFFIHQQFVDIGKHDSQGRAYDVTTGGKVVFGEFT